MPTTIRKVSYAYVTAASKPGEAARILQALRDANVNLLAFSGFPQGRNKAQIDVVTDDLDALKGVARGRKWRSEEHTSELQSQSNLVCRLLLEKKQKNVGCRDAISDQRSAPRSLRLQCASH